MAGRSGRKAELLVRASQAVTRIGLAAAAVVITSDNLQTAVANGDTRALSLHHTHTNEDLTITFKRNGRYDEEGLKKLNWFLRDWRTDEPTKMDPKLFDIVWEVHRELNASAPVQIISAYRSPKTNAMLRRRSRGVARFSQHMLGRAMDFYIPHVRLEDIRVAGLRLQRGGVGYYPTSGSPFVHLDTGNVRHWPRLTPQEMARVFPKGRPTVLARADSGRANDASTEPSDKPKPGLLAKLFGFGTDEEDDDVVSSASGASTPKLPALVRQAHAENTPAPSYVPIPVARPSSRIAQSAPSTPSRPSGFALASASQAPVPPADIPSVSNDSPAGVVAARGMWEPGAGSGASDAAVNRQRLVWVAGPQEHQIESRGGARLRAADREAEATGSVAPWPIADLDASRADRVPTELALAYAATATQADNAAPKAAPMGHVRSASQPPARAPRPQAVGSDPPTAAVQTKAGPRGDDPWLRGVVVSPSVAYSMQVAVLGAIDYRSLRPQMRKPASVVAMTFSSEPYDGMTADSFSGSAVSFVPVVGFGQRTASLN